MKHFMNHVFVMKLDVAVEWEMFLLQQLVIL